MTTPPLPGTLLLTGAGGTLGRALAPVLQPLAPRLRLSDRADVLARVPDLPGAEFVPAELADSDAVHRLLHGVRAVLHLGGVSVEGPWGPIVQANVIGVNHLYEAARRQGVRRIVLASSNHVTGGYAMDRPTTPEDPPRPDGWYGVSKLYAEGVARMHFDRHGIESVCLRIGTATPEPADRRALATWISLPDLGRLVTAALTAPDVGFTVAYGVSANTRRFWHCDEAWARLGFRPQDDAEVFAAQVADRWLPPGPQRERQGGSFLGIDPLQAP